MNTLISILLAILNDITTDNTVREISKQILVNYHQFDNVKISQLAESSFCNASTVTRFCKSLGFSSFSELKNFMIVSHETRIEQLRHHMELMDENSILDIIRCVCGDSFNIKEFKKECRKINSILYKSPRAVMIGAGFPIALTLHYIEDMIEMNKCIYNAPIDRALKAPPSDPETTVMLVSFTGRLVNYCLQEYSEIVASFPKTILITGNREIKKSSEKEMIMYLPFEDDDEKNNTAFLEIMRYLKYDYYRTYFKRDSS